MLGDDIAVSVVEIRGDMVRLGVEAPRHIKVYRKEVYDSITHETLAAVASPAALPSLDL
jgi:carbon storage regulator